MFNLFPAFFDHPSTDSFQFENQEKDEKIDLFLRQHWVVNIPWIVLALVALILPFLLFTYGADIIINIPAQLVLGGLIIWYMLVVAYIFEKFLSWYYNIYIVTNQHLIDINFHSLLSREILEAGIDNVESASSKIPGIVRSLFNFGNVIVQTAAESQQISFINVPHPDVVSDRINDLRRLAKGELGAG